MIRAIGTDFVAQERLRRALGRVPRLRERLFTAAERDLPLPSLAARFAVKEAVAKALGSPGDLSWQDVSTVRGSAGEPVVKLAGASARRAEALGIDTWHVSISHDGGFALAFVVAEARTCGAGPAADAVAAPTRRAEGAQR
ncbi:holo-ACP synthase [Rarobacter incanus]|uniref:Holo-[acyl-carrier-protein] synthase n=1 Tax=Rarobacter incanus TaxID=153494 RepID=A0A542SR72_9MICO|nr:holo-ACP synthase [Rarobacter incanus]TQK77094.1 holo-[acyl-carrier protein] synthase [Rarobacter incanus]